jgi:serine/threonine-protein kinase haspin
MDDPAHGVRGTLIDLGLSRMDAGDGAGGERVHWTPFDDEIFMGEGWLTSNILLDQEAQNCLVLEGDYQFDVYRIMREYNGGAWEDFNPLTNVMVWILTLSRTVITKSN